MFLATPVLLAWLAVAAAATPLDESAAVVSSYPAGAVPADPAVLGAIAALGDEGGRPEATLLQHLVRHERDAVRDAAEAALAKLRERLHDAARVEFARSLPGSDALATAARDYGLPGVGPTEASCAVYADHLVGGESSEKPQYVSSISIRAGLSAARAQEDAGDTRGAVRRYALLAAAGDTEARAVLRRYGVDVERLLLGVWSRRGAGSPNLDPDVARRLATALADAIVAEGGDLALDVLAERVRGPEGPMREDATAALERLLERGPESAAADRARGALDGAISDLGRE